MKTQSLCVRGVLDLASDMRDVVKNTAQIGQQPTNRLYRAFTRFAVISVVCAAFNVSADSTDWMVIDLGTLGGNWSRPYDINEEGELVGTSQIDPEDDRYHAWYWTLDTGLVEIPTPINSRSKARSINNAGVIAGWSSIDGLGPQAMYIEDDTQYFLGTFGGHISKARQINEQNTITGHAQDSDQNRNAFRWQYDIQVLENLGTLGGDESEARSINNEDRIVGWSNLPESQFEHAFLWTEHAGMVALGTLGGSSSAAYGINDLNMVTGDSNTAAGPRHAFLWTVSGGMQSIGTLGGNESLGRGINNLGQIVGRSNISSGETHGFVWHEDTGMVDVNDLTAPDELWIIEEIRTINDAGYMAGIARLGGATHPHAVYLVPPLIMEEPTPGVAGELNWFLASGAIPDARVLLLGSPTTGPQLVPFCNPPVSIDIADPILISIATVSGNGIAKERVNVRQYMGDRAFYYQAVETTTYDCRKSEVLLFTFPE